jgi:hypothetical protein
MTKGQTLTTTKRAARLAVAGAAATATLLGLAPPSDAATIVGVLYEHKNFGGATLSITKEPNNYRCTPSRTDVDTEVARLLTSFNDRTSSFSGRVGCGMRIYENDTFGGSSLGYLDSTPDVGTAMNERASSVRIS